MIAQRAVITNKSSHDKMIILDASARDKVIILPTQIYEKMIALDDLMSILESYAEIERGGTDGSIQQRERLQDVARFAVQHAAGDIVEIGCLHGSTTVLFAEVAREFGRYVFAIDPWLIGTQNCDGGEYEIFCRTVEPYRDVIKERHHSSQNDEVIQELKHRPLAFAFVDGLHEYAAVLSDIGAVFHAALLAVDDTNGWSVEVKRAYADGAGTRTQIVNPLFTESYLL